MNNTYRILTYSNNLYIVQTRFTLIPFISFWINEDEQFDNIASAKEYVANLKVLATKPKLVDVTYID